jgi:hypothetical protein
MRYTLKHMSFIINTIFNIATGRIIYDANSLSYTPFGYLALKNSEKFFKKLLAIPCMLCYKMQTRDPVAQSVEQLTFNQWVSSSNLLGITISLYSL